MLSLQRLGYVFEDQIHEILVQTKLIVLREKDVVRKYGLHVKGIDHLIYHNDYIICIQDKTENKNIVLSTINHFITCVESVSHRENKKCIGIYLSKCGLTGPARISFYDANSRNKNLFLHLEDEDLSRLKYKLLELLYANQIYLYDSDDCSYMLSSDKRFI